MSGATSSQQRSFVLIAVLVVIGSSLLVATGLLFVAQTEAAAAAGAREAVQTRALAWSGVQIVMAQINDQRDRIRRGQTPGLDEHFVVYESGNRQGAIQLLPASGRAGQPTLVPEAGKLDLNQVSAEALTVTGCVSSDEAQAVISYRDGAPGGRLQSVIDLLRVPGAVITAESLFGLDDEGTLSGDQETSSDVSSYRGLADLLTVHTLEPQVQVSGDARINLNVPWSEELGKRVEARFDRDAADLLKKLFESGVKFENDAAMVSTLRRLQVAPEEWGPILDTFTTDDQPMRNGRLDINTATAEALRALPGVTSELADQMVRVRSELSDDERASIAWPVTEQIIAPEAFESLAARITNRSWSWRIRLAAGETKIDEPGAWIGRAAMYEAVIDLSGSVPRVAYLRDISVLQETAAIVADVRSRNADILPGPVAPEFDSRESNRVPAPTGETEAVTRVVPEPAEARPESESPVNIRVGRWRAP